MQDNTIDLNSIDIRTLPPEHWEAVLRQATRRAHLERSMACRDLAGRARRGVLDRARRILSAGSRGRTRAATEL